MQAPVGYNVGVLALSLLTLLSCTKTVNREITLGVPEGALSGPVKVSATGHFDQLALTVDDVALSGGDGPALTTVWDTTTVGDGEHVLKAIGFTGDEAPVEDSATVTVLQGSSDVTAPAIAFTDPVEGAEMNSGDSIYVALTVTDDVGIATVDVYGNDALIASLPAEGPYSVPWFAAPGPWTLRGVATDAAGNVGEDDVNLTVVEGAGVECTLTHPDDGDRVSGDVQMSGAGTSDDGIASMEFFVNGDSVSVDTDVPWGYLWNSDAWLDEDVVLGVTCTTSAGDTGSDALTVHVSPTAADFTVTVTGPPDGKTVTGNAVTIKASIGGWEGADHAEFYIDGTLASTDTSAPWSLAWDSTTVANGEHTLLVKGFEKTTGATAEDSVTVTSAN